MKELFFVEVTDTFCGEANYSWATRHVVKAKSVLGAIQWLSRATGLKWRFDGVRYNSASGATCAFIEYFDSEAHGGYKLSTDMREVNDGYALA